MAKLKVKTGGGGEGEQPKAKSLSYPQINLWSDFVEANPNIKGMDAMWEAFSKANPKAGIDRVILQSNLDSLMKRMQERGTAWGENSPQSLTPGLSFPRMNYNNTPFGRVNANMETEVPIPQPQQTYPAKLIQKEIPKDAKDFWWDDNKGLWAYDDPHEGVIKYAQKSAGNTPQMREIAAKVYLSQKKPNP